MKPKINYKIATKHEAADVIMRMIAGDPPQKNSDVRTKSFLDFAQRYRIDISRQPIATLDDKLVGYALILVAPGASASVFLPEAFPPPTTQKSEREITVDLLKLLVTQMAKWDIALIQTVITNSNFKNLKYFIESGFSKLCDLSIMEAKATVENSLLLSEDVEWIPLSKNTEKRFEQTILETYQDSHDCPALTGLRSGEEILIGHRYSGTFEQKGWWLLQHENKDAGVILLNSSEEAPDHLELVYMGLAKWARGLDLGKALLTKAFDVAQILDKKIIHLAVDQKNLPAINIYEKFGFEKTNEQTVLIAINEQRRKKIAKQQYTER